MLTIIAVLCVVAIVVALLWPRPRLVETGTAVFPAPAPATGGQAVSQPPHAATIAVSPTSQPSRADKAWEKAERILVMAEEIANRFGAEPNWQARRNERLLDLALLIHEGLEWVSLDLFTRGKKILVRYLFFTEPQGKAKPDIFHDYELPFLENAVLVGARLNVPATVIEQSSNRLRTLPDAHSELTDRTKDGFPCPHIAQRTDGLLHGEIRVGLQPRRRAVVLDVAADGRSARAAVDGLPIFLHQSNFQSSSGSPRAVLSPNCREVSCVVVQTPLGLQGRCIRVCGPGCRPAARS